MANRDAKWKRLETRVAKLFLQCGCRAEKTIVRAGEIQYEVDCLVTFEALGLPTKWVVECKDWGTRVPQEIVVSLRQRVTDLGADKGILVCPAGFQKGALRQAAISSIILITPDELEQKLYEEFRSLALIAAYALLRELNDRVTSYRLHLENYLYEYENSRDIEVERRCYDRLLLYRSPCLMIQMHLEQWEAGRPSIGPPADTSFLDCGGDFRKATGGKTDFRDDREMLKHVLTLISQLKRRLGEEAEFVERVPAAPPSPVGAAPMKGPRYFPRPPAFKR